MDKYIKAQDLIDRIYPVDPENDGSDGCTVVTQNLTLSSPEIEAIVEELPAADIAPVVRCWECKYLIAVKADNGDAMQICNRTKFPVCFDDFCSRGEKAN